jgi:hypothetical protein
MDAVCFSETSVDFERTTPLYIPEDRTLHNKRRKKVLNKTVFRNKFLREAAEYNDIRNAIIRT